MAVGDIGSAAALCRGAQLPTASALAHEGQEISAAQLSASAAEFATGPAEHGPRPLLLDQTLVPGERPPGGRCSRSV
ncbi:hypothetical protein [Streptomyces sioyaensis]|uniref:hypothetical protein n=1 Tax=Streptomyces sioyaensis TaxID=67364 RepID=UPI00379D8E6B